MRDDVGDEGRSGLAFDDCFKGRYVKYGSHQIDESPYSMHLSSTHGNPNCARWVDYRWVPQASCPAQLHSGFGHGAYYDVCSWLSGHHILFVGDSVTNQMFVSLLLLSGFSGGKKRLAGMWAFGEAMVCNRSARIRFERSDFLNLAGEPPTPNIHGKPQSGYSHLRSWSLLQEYDTAVLNTGVHLQQQSALRDRVHSLAKVFAALPSNVTLVWRTTVPGHDNCSAATEPLTNKYVPLPKGMYGWDRVEGQNTLIQSIFERIAPGRLRYLDAFALANTRADGHIVSKTKFMTTSDGRKVSYPVVDCLHYCMPGPVEIWNVLFTRLFLKSRRQQQKEGGKPDTRRLRRRPNLPYIFICPSYTFQRRQPRGAASSVNTGSVHTWASSRKVTPSHMH